MEHLDCVVVGAGVVGLAVARNLALAGREVVVVERQDVVGSETSSRNSEVIHAGIYYPTNSLKARFCVRGKQLLYSYCERNSVPHARLGKLIVATTDDQRGVLEEYRDRAVRNGVGELDPLTGGQVLDLEPAVRAVAGLYSASTGIIDSHAFMMALQGELEAAGGLVVCRTEVVSMEQGQSGLVLRTPDYGLGARLVVNAAGLAAPQLAATIVDQVPAPRYARGHYYTLMGPSPFRHLVYPVAEPGGLGVHVTLDMAGQARFGPDVQWIDKVDYTFDASRRHQFVDAIRRYYPDLDPERLQEGYTGIRPKLGGPDDPAPDFRVDDEQTHGVAGLINLLGIESPGLTAALAIAEQVEALACSP